MHECEICVILIADVGLRPAGSGDSTPIIVLPGPRAAARAGSPIMPLAVILPSLSVLSNTTRPCPGHANECTVHKIILIQLC